MKEVLGACFRTAMGWLGSTPRGTSVEPPVPESRGLVARKTRRPIPAIRREERVATPSRRFTTCLAVALVFLLVGLATTARGSDTSDLVGTWRMKTDFGGRSFISMLKFQRDGDRLTGVLVRREGRSSELENVRFEDGRISFQRVARRNAGDFVTSYRGTVGPEKITGEIEFRRGAEKRIWEWEAERADDVDLAPRQEEPPVAADIALDERNYSVWRDHILPADDELAWQRIPWLSTFKDGILAADQSAKPLLLWTMNGHPLGCT